MVALLHYSSQSKFESQRSSCQPDHHPSYERATDGAGKSGDNVSIPILVIHSPFSQYDRTEYICQKDNFLKSQHFQNWTEKVPCCFFLLLLFTFHRMLYCLVQGLFFAGWTFRHVDK